MTAFSEFAAAGLWPGLGRTLAAGLAAAGIAGPDDVRRNRLAALPGVTPARADRLVTGWSGVADSFAVAELLVPAGLPVRLAPRAVAELGRSAARRLGEDPWRLLDLAEVRPDDADRLARSLLGPTTGEDPRRGSALVAHVLTRAARDGHTAMPVETLLAAVAGESVADPRAAVAAAFDADRVLSAPAYDAAGRVTGELLALNRYALAEDFIADGLARLLATGEPWAPAEAVDSLGAELDGAQRAAVAQALELGVSILTGGPGTGKSRTVATVVALAQQAGRQVALAAPTGRAAKRLEELTGAPATTLHRLLGAQGTTGGFARGESWPLDVDLVVVDEASMLDAELAAALVAACDEGSHLLLVGDPAQLPSIGAGRVLGDLVDSGALAVTELTTLYRQAEGGAIARLATAVRGGSLPVVDSADHEVVIVAAAGAAEAARRTVQLVTDSIPRVLAISPDDVQVVTPVHRGPAGTVGLNQALKAALNPGDGEVGGYDVGDRVVATANHLDDGFANGEVGVVVATKDGGLVVAFAGGPVTVPARALVDLKHGWAITVHRAQGSEWPAVVAVLPAEAAGLLSRPLVYTGFTRAQRHLSVVHAAGPALARAVHDIGARPRRTQLRQLVRAAVEPVRATSR
ncbi:MAG: AAA family ATPase [Actinomycetota bacterium]|nr:AAA family ATPase [Actinomycetota bacterium]